MPWDIEERDGQYCVIKRDDGANEGCHATRDAAEAQMAALYASENKEIEEKRSDKPGDYLIVEDEEKPTTWHLQVRVDGKPDHNLMGAAWAALHSGHRGNVYEGPDKAGALRKLTALYKSEEMDTPKSDDMDEDDEMEDEGKAVDSFFIYKAADGTNRWASISSVAIKDKEFEIVTEQAYDDAIEHAKNTGDYGELDLVHVDGTDVGDCDLMMRVGNKLVEGGMFYDTEMARGVIRAVQDEPDYWGVSIKFVFDPSKFDGEKYGGNIRIRKRTILPQEMAASFGTRLVAVGGKAMDNELSDKAREALEKLNVPEEQIEALAEKQKATEADEPNTVEKEAEEATVETIEVAEEAPQKKSVWERLKEVLSNMAAHDEADALDAETGSEEGNEVEPVEAQENDAKQIDYEVLAKAISTPLIEKMAEMQATYQAEIAQLKARLDAAEEVVEDKVISKLVELPQVVKVRASEVEATAQPEERRGPVLPQATPGADNYVQNLIADVNRAVTDAITNAQPKVQV